LLNLLLLSSLLLMELEFHIVGRRRQAKLGKDGLCELSDFFMRYMGRKRRRAEKFVFFSRIATVYESSQRSWLELAGDATEDSYLLDGD
jgi:hypothetical protein